MLNKCFIMGRLTAKPELKYTSNNKAYTRFRVAVNRYGEGTDFINVMVWNKQAENVCEYLEKGRLLLVEGVINTSNYEDADGNKRISFDVVAQNVQFLDRKKTSESEESEEVEESYQEDDNVELDDNFLD